MSAVPKSDFPEQLPHGTLEEVLPEVFFVSGQTRPTFGGAALQFSRNMVVIRDGQDLTLINTLRLDAAGLADLDALGTVKNIVKLGSFHGRDDAFYLDRYDADFWAPDAMTHERGVTTDTVLTPGTAGPCAGSSVFAFETSDMPESLLHLERHGGILISCDSLQNLTGPDEYFDEDSAKSMRRAGFFNPANVGPGWRNAAKPEASDFSRVKKLQFRHLLSAHGVPLLNTAHEELSLTFGELYQV